MILADLFVYPVKSLRGCRVETAEVDDLGLVGDRRFLVVDESGRFLTQRVIPRMALVRTALSPGMLTLAADGGGTCEVARTAPAGSAPIRSVSVWKSEGLLAEDCGEEPAKWLSAIFKVTCRLVRIGAQFRRPILKPVAGPGDIVHFGDAFPFLVISEASLTDLNDRLAAREEPVVPMNRFRPNLVVRGCAPYAEDTWPRFRVGEITFHAGGPCGRCVVTTTNQETAERGSEPLRTLATYRRDAADPTDVNFGQNLIHETKRGTLRIGDAVELLA